MPRRVWIYALLLLSLFTCLRLGAEDSGVPPDVARLEAAWLALEPVSDSLPQALPIQTALNALHQKLEADAAPLDARVAVLESLARSHFRFAPFSDEKNPGWAVYDRLLEMLANESDLEGARRHYLRIVFGLFEPGETSTEYRFPAPAAARVELRVEHAVRLARGENEGARAASLRAHARIAQLWRDLDQPLGSPKTNTPNAAPILPAIQAIRDDLKAALAVASAEPWTRVALQSRARLELTTGFQTFAADGKIGFEPNYAEALVWLDRLAQMPGAGKLGTWALEQAKDIRKPQVQFDGVDGSRRSQTPFSFGLALAGNTEATVQIFPLRSGQLLLPMEQKTESGTRTVSTEEQIELDPLMPPLWERAVRVTPRRPHYFAWTDITMDAPLPEGLYLLQVRAGDLIERQILDLADHGLAAVVSNGELHAWATDLATGKPLPNALVRVWGEGIGQALESRTDASGLAVVRLPQKPESRWREYFLWMQLTTSAGEVLSSLRYVPDETPEPQNWWSRGATDRQIYRPGEDVQWWCVLRQLTADGQVTIPAGKVRWELDVAAEKVSEGELALDADGMVQGTLSLPAGRVGNAGLTVFQGEGREWLAFRIEDFKAPELIIRPKLDHGGQYFIGEPLAGSVSVVWPSGEPVVGGTVVVSLPRLGLRQELKLDAQGWGAFSLSPASTVDPLQGRATKSWMLDFQASGVGRASAQTQKPVVYRPRQWPTAYGIYPEVNYARVGEAVRFAVGSKVMKGRERSLPGRGQLRLVRRQWKETYVHVDNRSEITGEAWRALPPSAFFGAVQADYRLKDRGYENTLIASEELAIPDSEPVDWSHSFAQAGYYQLSWVGTDSQGRTVEAAREFWVIADGVRDLGYRPEGLLVVARQAQVQAPIPAEFLILSPEPDRPAMLWRAGVRDALCQTVPLRGYWALASIPAAASDWSIYMIQAALAGESGLLVTPKFTKAESLPGPPSFELKLASDTGAYEPGSSAHLQLRWLDTDKRSKPVGPVRLVLAVADEAYLGSSSPVSSFALGRSTDDQGRNRYGALKASHAFEAVTSKNLIEYVDFGDRLLGPWHWLVPYLGLVPTHPGWRTELRVSLVREGQTLVFSADGRLGFDAKSPPPRLRSNLRATAYWNAQLRTDAQGEAVVSFPLPDNLTTWKARAWAVTDDHRYAVGECEFQTRLPLSARLLTPRFLTVGDRIALGGALQNHQATEVALRSRLEVSDRLRLERAGEATVALGAAGASRVEWPAQAVAPGEAWVRLWASGTDQGDAMERRFPVLPAGVEGRAGLAVRTAAERWTGEFELPAFFQPAETSFTLHLAPGLTAVLLDALPYLIDYPYECTEQSLSRLVPALQVRRTLEDLGVGEDALRSAYPDRAELANDLPPEAVVNAVLQRLVELQRADGAYPWMPGGPADEAMTAYAVEMLSLARVAGLSFDQTLLDRARDWLLRRLEETPPAAADDTTALLLCATAARFGSESEERPTRGEARAMLALIGRQTDLRAAALARLVLAADRLGFTEDAQELLRTLRGRALGDTTATRWPAGAHATEIESTALAVRALLAVDPEDRRVDPAVDWLLRNRRGSHWAHTRETAQVVLALDEYLVHRGEATGPGGFELRVNGQPVAEQAMAALNPLRQARHLSIEPSLLRAGSNQVELLQGPTKSPFSLVADVRYRDLRQPLPEQAQGLRLTRSLMRLRSVPTLLQGTREEAVLLLPGSYLQVGDRLESQIILVVDQPLPYLLVEDPHAAGLESITDGERVELQELKPGTTPAHLASDAHLPRRVSAHAEWRDQKLALFVEQLPAGTWLLRRRLRCDQAGEFTVPPARAEAMYAPEIWARSTAPRIEIRSAP